MTRKELIEAVYEHMEHMDLRELCVSTILDALNEIWIERKHAGQFMDLFDRDEECWISCSERLPEINVDIIQFPRDLDFEIFGVLTNRWLGTEWCRNNPTPTHWRPLPEPPRDV